MNNEYFQDSADFNQGHYPNSSFTQPEAPIVQGGLYPVSDEDINSLKFNYWLSLIFTIIPAIIYYFTKRGRHPLVDRYLKANLWVSLIRFLMGVAQNCILVYINLSVQLALQGREQIPDLGAYSMLSRIIGPINILLFIAQIILAATVASRIKEGKKPILLG